MHFLRYNPAGTITSFHEHEGIVESLAYATVVSADDTPRVHMLSAGSEGKIIRYEQIQLNSHKYYQEVLVELSAKDPCSYLHFIGESNTLIAVLASGVICTPERCWTNKNFG
jgi:hypothetical protein